jgi:hypothetical protein
MYARRLKAQAEACENAAKIADSRHRRDRMYGKAEGLRDAAGLLLRAAMRDDE